MNLNATCYEVVSELPYKLTLTFKSLPPDKGDLRPVFKRLGDDKCLAKLQILESKGKQVSLLLPANLACLGEGRYEVCLHDKCCAPCDCVEVWFEADCEIVEMSGEVICETV